MSENIKLLLEEVLDLRNEKVDLESRINNLYREKYVTTYEHSRAY